MSSDRFKVIEEFHKLFRDFDYYPERKTNYIDKFSTLTTTLSKEYSEGKSERLKLFLARLQSILKTSFDNIIKEVANVTSLNVQSILWVEGVYPYKRVILQAIGDLYWSISVADREKLTQQLKSTSDSLIFIDLLFSHKRYLQIQNDRDDLLYFLKVLKSFFPDYDFSPVLKSSCRDEHLIWLWLEGYYSNIELKVISENIPKFGSEDQQHIIKKLFNSISTKGIDFPISLLQKIAPTDLSSKIVIKLITTNNSIPKISVAYLTELFVDCIEKPEQISEIFGYFEKCTGRTLLVKIEKDKYAFKKGTVPPFVKFCEGRKSKQEKLTEDEPPFWWCRNMPCYKAEQNYIDSNDWRNYTLRNLLQIIGINFNSDQYFLLLGYINKLNQYITHLKCAECGAILRPIKQSKWGFYRASLFHCTNKYCTSAKNNTPIYISHCINNYCHEIIDSRDGAAKCYHPSVPEGYMYICPNCYACCTTDVIDRRRSILTKMSEKYNGPAHGHKDMEQICCIKCGYPMEPEFKKEKYLKALLWLNENKENSNIISKYGPIKDGGKWFLLKSSFFKSKKEFKQKLANLRSFGFEVPNIDKDRDMQLVGTNFKGINNFKCSRCGHTLNLIELVHSKEASNREKLLALKKYHKSIENMFPTTRGKTIKWL